VNRAGPSFVNEIAYKTGQDWPAIARAYLMARQSFDLRALWAAIEALDNKVPAKLQVALNLDIVRLIRRATSWFLRSEHLAQPIAKVVDEFAPDIETVADGLEALLPEDLRQWLRERAKAYEADGVPADLARRIGALGIMASAPDIVRIAHSTGRKIEDVARIYFALGSRIGFDWLRQAAEKVVAESEWQKLAVSAVVDDLYVQQCLLTSQVLAAINGHKPDAGAVEHWIETKDHAAHRVQDLLKEFRTAGGADLAMLTVASRELRALVQN
jgi:glutamate dehydrogenase